jgi:hypothetical protein
MNWIEIDAILYKIIARHHTVDDMLSEAQKHFKWTPSQADDALRPLLKRSGHNLDSVISTVEKKTKRK